jgi:hypothetical protein
LPYANAVPPRRARKLLEIQAIEFGRDCGTGAHCRMRGKICRPFTGD